MQGKRALITGGSAGVGAAVAIKLASLGATCAVNYANDSSRAEELLGKLAGSGHKLVKGSMFTKPEAQAVVAEALQSLGGLDYIVSNAGWTRFGAFNDLDALADEDWDKCYAANVKSHLWVMQAAREELAKNKGSFVITASQAGLKPGGSSMAYSVSKAAGIHIAASLAKACAPDIIVNSIAPGLLRTDWTKGVPDERMEQAGKAAALQRLATPEDCAGVVAALLMNRGITGQCIEISAGAML